jgi:hypothetical protein
MPGQYMDRDIIYTRDGVIERLKEEIATLQATVEANRATVYNMHINNRALRVDLLQNHIAVLVATVEAQQTTLATLANEYKRLDQDFEVLRQALVDIEGRKA